MLLECSVQICNVENVLKDEHKVSCMFLSKYRFYKLSRTQAMMRDLFNKIITNIVVA